MWPRIMVFVALVLSGCAVRVAERNAPDLTFVGPIPPRSLSSAQIKLVEQSIAKGLKDSARFGRSYRAGVNSNRDIVVCGYVNGKRFVGMFAKPKGAPTEFLPIRVGIDEEEERAAKEYCRADGIYLPQ